MEFEVECEMADYITTSQKIHFTPLKPEPSQILIEDIAHALSLMTRANGHFPEFYSVAQHSVQCCEEAAARGYSRRVILACLLHDASEAYLADITRPVKKNLTGYLACEKVLQDAIYIRFLGSVPDETERELVEEVDDSLLSHEFHHYMGEKLFDREFTLKTEPKFREEKFRDMEEKFLTLYKKYS